MRHELVIAVPTDRPLGKEYDDWLRTKAEEASQALPEFQVVVFVSENENASHNLNAIVAAFLANKAATWLWIVRPDLVWSARDLASLIAAGRPVIGILHTQCTDWPAWQASFYDDLVPSEDGVLQVPEISGNGMLVHRTVFERILAHPPFSLAFRDDGSWETHHAFFQQARVALKGANRLLSESAFFLWLCRECAIGIYAHTKVRLQRKGPDGVLYPKAGQEPNLIPIPPPDASQWESPDLEGKFVVIIQHWEQDEAEAKRLFHFIAQHSRTSVDHSVLLMANPFKGLRYPDGPNAFAHHLITTAPTAAWARNAKCILFIEPDCVPVARDWIDQLSAEWDRAETHDKLVVGHWNRESGGHINGNMMFSPFLAKTVDLGPTHPRRPWDVAYAPIFAPHWARTGLIKNLYRRTEVTPEEIETPACGTKKPVLIHGVRDESAWGYVSKKFAQ